MNSGAFERRPTVKLLLAYLYCLGLFALTAFLGMAGPGDFADATNTLQRLCSIAVTAYAILGVLAAVGLLARHRWALRVTAAWAAMLVAAAVLAPMAWAPGESSWWSILLGALLAAALGWTVYLLVERLVHPKPISEAQ